ncbi:MAG TPA: helix-turn-helix transcriptional regulator [Thermoanaerobaculia bacterium]|nr:helix-turn-helix transcriptional regulator [Thermoanaerobaculia bacterium]
MPRMRHVRPDGSVWVRTFPLTCLHDHTSSAHVHEWDQLTYATSGVMHVHTDSASWLVPPHRAVWLPAGVEHTEQMHAPVSVRTLYLAPKLAKALPRECCIVNIPPLMRELILHICRIGVLDRRIPTQAHLISVLLDELVGVSDVPLQLPMPRDPRARCLAVSLQAAPDDDGSVAALSRRAGASRRTMERLFLAETRMTVGEWRRRLRLLHGVHNLARGESVANAALDAGYASTSAFIAAFKRMFGMTPSRYSV